MTGPSTDSYAFVKCAAADCEILFHSNRNINRQMSKKWMACLLGCEMVRCAVGLFLFASPIRGNGLLDFSHECQPWPLLLGFSLPAFAPPKAPSSPTHPLATVNLSFNPVMDWMLLACVWWLIFAWQFTLLLIFSLVFLAYLLLGYVIEPLLEYIFG